MEIRDRQMNLQGLLRFALEYTKNEDTTNKTTFEEMDPERKKFLEDAMSSMTVDVIKEFEKAISTLECEELPVADKVNAFTTLRDYIDNIDFANNFVKVGGSNILMKHLDHSSFPLRFNSMYVIAEMSQNNPFCQQHFIDADIFPKLLANLKENEDVASAAVYTISSLVRSFEPGLIEFLRLGGIQSLMSCLDRKEERVFSKTCFLIASLSSKYPDVRDKLVEKSAMSQIVKNVDVVNGFDSKIETALFALSELSKSSKWSPDQAEKSQIETVLTALIDDNKNLPECEEMVSYARTVLQNMDKTQTHPENT